MDIQTDLSTPQSGRTQTSTNSVISSDFETFLNLLTAQLQNQDPSDPVDSDDYAAQLAQFSSVEQQVLTNDLLTRLTQQSQVSGLGQMAGWVGMEARTTAPAFFDGAPLTLLPEPIARADTRALVVYDARGTEVARESLPAEPGPIDWVGRDASGAPLPAGAYTFRIESQLDGQIVQRDPVAHYARVTEVRVEDGANVAIISGGAAVPAGEITALRS
ncbi:flagellar hook capping FlgD N-terminal domain-containing protein [Aestuariibius insulae]|uniref:flagellar hook capping FlgD N-terminal domain-containing protein n=1 Tax=Aestuariibius insulae TaxID=2058287 RepID=UPI00345EAB80